MTLVCIDTETTGLDCKKNCIWQVSGLVYKDGDIEHFNYKMKPFYGEPVSKELSEKLHVYQEVLDTYPDQKLAYDSFNEMMKKYTRNEFGRREKVTLIGYNVGFDINFLTEWFKYNGNEYGLRNYFYFPHIDVMNLASVYLLLERPFLKNFKLSTVYEKVFSKPLENAHDANSDALGTWELFKKIMTDLSNGHFNNNILEKYILSKKENPT